MDDPSKTEKRLTAATVGQLFWCLFTGAGLCFLALSALERRLCAGLLLPFQDGQFLPVRAAVWIGALALTAGVVYTEPGKRLRQRLRSALEKDRYRWLASAVVTGLFFLWAWRVTVFMFMTNDDTAILKAIGRAARQGPAGTDTFSSPLFCAMLGLLYRLAPGGHWYAWYHLAVIGVSLAVAGRCVLLKTCRGSLPVSAGFIIHALLAMGLFLYTLAELSFTVTPAAAGAAAAALILCRGDTPGRLGHALSDAGGVLLTALCCIQRWSAGRCFLCFWALAMGYRLLRLLIRRERKRLLPWAVCAVLTPAVALGAVSVRFPAPPSTAGDSPSDSFGYAYADAEHYRSQVMDYILKDMTDEDLEAAGLPRELSALLRAWFFMDERINTDTFKTIVSVYDAAHPTGVPENGGGTRQGLWPSFTERLRSAIGNETAGRVFCMKATAAGLALLLALVLLRLFRYGRVGWPETLCGLCAAGGAALLLIYLILDGRFLLRVFLVVAIPAAVVMLLMALDVPVPVEWRRTRPVCTALSAAVAAGLCALCLLNAGNVPYASQSISRRQVTAVQRDMEGYVGAHGDTTFITNGIFQDLDPFHAPDAYPANLINWGGTGVTASSDRLYADAFFRDDVRFLTDKPAAVILLLQYLTLDRGPVQALSAVKLSGGVAVYDLSQLRPERDGWYEQNGMTYYFRDGHALTGEQTIDGTAYTFAPVGADAQLVVVPGPEGLIYTTDAYSLVSPEA